jgi:hypothetical protein
VFEQVDPPITRPVINEGDSVVVAGQCEHGNHVHVGVNALQQVRCAVQSLLGEGVGVVFANNTRLTVQQKRGVVVNDKAVRDVALDCLLEQVLANVSQALMPKGMVLNILATQCTLRRVRRAHIKPCSLVANCCSEVLILGYL